MSNLGELIRAKLLETEPGHPEYESVPFPQASILFYDHVCVFIEQKLGECELSWALWLDIRGTWLGGRKVDAIKMLRKAIRKTELVPCEVPSYMMQNGFTEYVRKYAQREEHITLGLAEAKSILDWLGHDEDVFNVGSD